MKLELKLSQRGLNNSDCDLIFADTTIIELVCVCGEAECSGILFCVVERNVVERNVVERNGSDWS